MPRIDKVLTLDITPERFVNACNDVEFQELQIEIYKRIQREDLGIQLSIEDEINESNE